MDAPVLLTGATGYIGGRLLRRFEDGGRAVRRLVRQPSRLTGAPPRPLSARYGAAAFATVCLGNSSAWNGQAVRHWAYDSRTF